MQLIDVNKCILNKKKRKTTSWFYSDGNFDILEEEKSYSLESNLNSRVLEDTTHLPGVLTSSPPELVSLATVSLSDVATSHIVPSHDGLVISSSVEGLERRVQRLESELSELREANRTFQNIIERIANNWVNL